MSAATTMSRLAFGREADTGAHVVPWVSPVLIGRIFLATIFMITGVGKFLNWSGNLAYLEAETPLTGAPILIGIAAVIEIVAGLSILTGTLARIGALVLFGYLAVVTYFFHDFWLLSGAERQLQMIMFLKNLSIMGGLLLLVGFGPGRASLDTKLKPSHGA
jgi:putative oxidoreductase